MQVLDLLPPLFVAILISVENPNIPINIKIRKESGILQEEFQKRSE